METDRKIKRMFLFTVLVATLLVLALLVLVFVSF
jgi:putative effector of murein hydrolase